MHNDGDEVLREVAAELREEMSAAREERAAQRELITAVRAFAGTRTASSSVSMIDGGKAASWITASASLFIAGLCIAALIIGGVVAGGYANLLNGQIADSRSREAELQAYHEQDAKAIAALRAQIEDLRRDLKEARK